MSNHHPHRIRSIGSAAALALVVLVLPGCNLPGGRTVPLTLTPLPPAAASVTASPSGPTPATAPPATALPAVASNWETLQPGFDLLTAPIVVNDVVAQATLVRIDPALYRIRVAYAPGDPARVSEWRSRLKALMVINGGFFLRDNQTNGLLVSDGKRFGFTFDRHGGMMSVFEGKVEVRSLAEVPYRPTEKIDQAVQGRPMLIYPGGFPVSIDDLQPDAGRRTALAQDRQGRLVFIVVDQGVVTLFRLRDWMSIEHPDLDLFVAFNLDGGDSTGLALQVSGRALDINSRAELPGVIAIYGK